MNIDLNNIKRVHCVGIGGIGVSAIARLFASRGAEVSGSDMNESPVTEGLREGGITVTIGHDKANLPTDADLVIHTIAVPADNPEIIAAKQEDVPVMTYPETLGLLSESLFTVAVSGTHGKTTTTAMLARILMTADKDPTVIVGSLLHEQKSNFIDGGSDLLVVEACEYRRSFLHLSPDILVITNIDNDHLDYFDGLNDIQSAFRSLTERVADEGKIVCDPADPRVEPVVYQAAADIVDFADIDLGGDLVVPGEHNRQNGRAAAAAAEQLEVSLDQATSAVREFSGTWRRAQEKGQLESGALVFDDYGHHPTEVRSTLEGFRERYPDRILVVAFQPHLYSRTKKLLSDFAVSFDAADEVVVLPIYAARETPDPEVSSDQLVQALQDNEVSAQLVADFSEAEAKLRDLAGEDALILTQGAGDVYKVADSLVEG